MAQLLHIAKARVRDVGGESHVSYLCDDGRAGWQTLRFSPEKEDVYDFFLMHGRSLLIATGTEGVTDQQMDELGAKFIVDLKWKRARLFE